MALVSVNVIIKIITKNKSVLCFIFFVKVVLFRLKVSAGIESLISPETSVKIKSFYFISIV